MAFAAPGASPAASRTGLEASGAGGAASGTGPVEPVRHVYVHAPFCARRCVYCDFPVSVARSPDARPWLAALSAELASLAREGVFVLADRLETVYVGGGTPSLLGIRAMEGLARLFGPSRLAEDHLEWTGEANPESFTPELAEAWAASGVNRVSLGIQSFHEPTLGWMGRLHGPQGAIRAVATARAVGLTNLSVDLIFGLPDHLGRDWARDLDEALALDPPHLSLYGLSVEPATALGRAVAEGREPPLDEDRYREEFLQACEALRAAGYEQYEVSNFCRPEFASRHNSAYWRGAAYLGLGNGAHSFKPGLRRWNQRDWADYQRATAQGRLPVAQHEALSEGARRLERIWLGLRARDGLELAPLPPRAIAVGDRWRTEGLADLSGGRLRLEPEGWLLLDRLAVELDRAMERASGAPADAREGCSTPLKPARGPGD